MVDEPLGLWAQVLDALEGTNAVNWLAGVDLQEGEQDVFFAQWAR